MTKLKVFSMKFGGVAGLSVKLCMVCSNNFMYPLLVYHYAILHTTPT